MNIVCLDLEGVLVPEIWIAVSEKARIPELRKTTRDEPDYDKLMKYRLKLLRKHQLHLKDIQEVISGIEPFPGAGEFLSELRQLTQCIIISDTFSQFAAPLMAKLHYPTIFCNELVTDAADNIVDYRMRCKKTKLTTVKALQSMGFSTIASGDSFNDLDMLRESSAGFLFRTTEAIREAHPEFPALSEYRELLDHIRPLLSPPKMLL